MNLYCPEHKAWVYDSNRDKFPIKQLCVVDKEMRGVVDRLWAMGIEILMASSTATLMEATINIYRICISIDLRDRIDEWVLGDLPAGWKFYWETITPDRSEVYMLCYVEQYYWFGFESVEEHVRDVIKELEDYLDTRDAEGTRAIMRLACC